MATIALIDHHLNNWHADTFIRLLRGPLSDQNLEIVVAWESDPTGEDWCLKHDVPRADTIASAIANVDAVFLLAPDNIEDHLALARQVLPAGKPTLIDKFLARVSSEAEEIVALADKYGTPFFTSSSLRYSVELEAVQPELDGVTVTEGRFTGIGKWQGYGVHTLCMAMRTMGADVSRVIDAGTPLARHITLDYADGRRAAVDMRHASNEYEALGWSFALKAGDRYVADQIKDFDGFYANLMRRAARFVHTGENDVSALEAVNIVKILEAAELSQSRGGDWITL